MTPVPASGCKQCFNCDRTDHLVLMYQLAEVGMEINRVKFTMEVAVAGTLPKSVLLGINAPIL